MIAGSARGVQLTAPRGAGIRPVTDRVKETLFGILGERAAEARVLDLYAGSGALGIEALSRGAAHADFVERDRRALVAIRANLQRTRLAARASVHGVDVARFLAGAPASAYDLVFVDPPYELRDPPLNRLPPLLASGGMVVVKHFWRTDLPAVPGLAPVRTRRFGETALTFLAQTDAQEVPPA
ncbi:MAG TPA: 16S rRNA (guanine(966)-N(2))-methyltransferase RsmD [candidate division Zixibacteria bacterium]|nr:16S rRNA (guanine(966)-N(2))-methyltransferase RsmD [candidate division Zixibacteria bacterium]